MAACQSSLLCAPGLLLLLLLLLLIGVISSHLPEVQGKPCNFWCDQQVRDSMVSATELKKDGAHCASVTLPSPVMLPCVRVRIAAWKNKTLQQKCEEVLADFQGFQEAVKVASKNSTQQCQSLLESLEHGIKTYILIVQRLRIQTDTMAPSPSPPAAPRCSSQTSELSKVLENYKNLLKKKFDLFAREVCVNQGLCNQH